MALITCPDCASDVSDKAPACLKCGSPIASASDVQSTGAQLTTVQETSKRLKLHTLGAVVMICVGVVLMIGAFNSTPPGNPTPPVYLIALGLGWYFVTRFRIWWHHK